jgi:hypothetical protein
VTVHLPGDVAPADLKTSFSHYTANQETRVGALPSVGSGQESRRSDRGGPALRFGGREMPRLQVASATVDVESRAGSADGVLATIAGYASASAMGFVENWPDGARHTYAGTAIKATDLEMWPATTVKATGGKPQD